MRLTTFKLKKKKVIWKSTLFLVFSCSFWNVTAKRNDRSGEWSYGKNRAWISFHVVVVIISSPFFWKCKSVKCVHWSSEINTWTPFSIKVLVIYKDYLDRHALFITWINKIWHGSERGLLPVFPHILSSCLCIMMWSVVGRNNSA